MGEYGTAASGAKRPFVRKRHLVTARVESYWFWNQTRGKRPFLTRGSRLHGFRLPVPGQQIVEAAHWMAAGHAFQHVLEVGKGLDLVELGGGDEGANGCPSGATAVGSREQVVLAPERHLPFILPMSGRKLKSIIAGIRSMVAVFDANTVSSAPTAGLCHVEAAPGVIIVLAAWMLDRAACADMVICRSPCRRSCRATIMRDLPMPGSPVRT